MRENSTLTTFFLPPCCGSCALTSALCGPWDCRRALRVLLLTSDGAGLTTTRRTRLCAKTASHTPPFGLLWREFGQTLLGEEADNFDEHFIQPLDLEDNTGCGHPLAAAIAAFNPCWDSDEDPDQNFEKAVQVAHAILTRKIAEVNGIRRAGSLVRAAISRMQNRIVVLDRYAPWKQFAVESDAQFVVYPSQRGGFSAQGVPVSQQDNTLRLPFPESWARAAAGELQRLSGIATLRFCHNNRFLISADTQEDAIQACLLTQQAAK